MRCHGVFKHTVFESDKDNSATMLWNAIIRGPKDPTGNTVAKRGEFLDDTVTHLPSEEGDKPRYILKQKPPWHKVVNNAHE